MLIFSRRAWLRVVGLILAGAGLSTLSRAQEYPPTLTPPSPHTPLIHGPKVFGAHPGHPFLFTVAATGDRPMSFSAEGLPVGLSLDAATGQITGTTPPAGSYKVQLHARNSLGETQRPLLIKAGKTLALTPPMGWNSWNCFAMYVNEDMVRAAVDAMVKSGLADHGWSYINIDDYWQVNPEKGKTDPTLAGMERNPDGSIRSNPRFPDMKGLADYIHTHGLKAGLYSSPGKYTCGGCTGSYQHEDQDARQYADWGYDYLKYDWCTYDDIYKKEDGGKGVAGLQKPYRTMAASLAKAPRDIVFSFCQYGWGDVWKWGAEVGGNCWRTTNDITHQWPSMFANASRGADLAQYAGPGHWNDPDMLVVGQLQLHPQHPTGLTPDEQYTHISLWCLEAAPLLIGCDLTKLDVFTLGLLTNDEVLDVDQDPFGHAASLLHSASDDQPTIQVWARPLSDGSLAVGLINIGDKAATGHVKWSDLKLKGPHKVRDLWRQQNLGTFEKRFEGQVPSHGVLLVRIGK